MPGMSAIRATRSRDSTPPGCTGGVSACPARRIDGVPSKGRNVAGDEQRTLSVSGGRRAGTRHLPAFPVSRTGADLGRVWGGVGAAWLRETRCDPAPGGGSDGKDVGEVVGKRAECDEPCADEDEDAAAPGLDGWGAVLDGVDEAFASGGEEHGQREGRRTRRARARRRGVAAAALLACAVRRGARARSAAS